MNSTLSSLLERRLVIVTGKGGTGKSCVAAALARLAAGAGRRTLVVEVGTESVLPRLLGLEPDPAVSPGETREVTPELSTLHIVPRVALEEYLELQLRVAAFARAVARNAAFSRLLDAAPGWRELITLGKLWHLSTRSVGGRPLWPLIVVDAPATGHGLSFLSVPRVVIDAVRIGPLRRHTERVQELLQDAERTRVLPVTLAEELPVSETLELCGRLADLGLAAGPLIANCVESAPALDAAPVLEALGSLPSGGPTGLCEPSALAGALTQRVRRASLQRGFLARLERETGLARLELPDLGEGIDGPEGIERLAAALVDATLRPEAAA